jgi:16S rRNA (cytidine1402-2'-O)-methyltransferase
MIVLVGTPIGNLGDLTPRAADALRAADVIACEDTRRTRQLLAHAGIPTPPMVVVNEHTESDQIGALLEHARAGRTVALVTDAGMPGISDPGERLVRAAADAGIAVSVVPGPSAVVAALVVSGLPTGRFCFEGFLPRKGSGRRERLAAAANERRTTVLFEAPHRLVETLSDLAAACGDDRQVVVTRELTKRFEEVWRGTLAGAVEHFGASEPRGELTLVLDGAPEPPPATDDDIRTALAAERAAGIDRKTAVANVTAALGVAKRRVYDLSLAPPESPGGRAGSRR